MLQYGMDKQTALDLLGGTVALAAREVGVTVRAVYDWPDPLPQRIADRVQAALWRRQNAHESADEPANHESRL